MHSSILEHMGMRSPRTQRAASSPNLTPRAPLRGDSVDMTDVDQSGDIDRSRKSEPLLALPSGEKRGPPSPESRHDGKRAKRGSFVEHILSSFARRLTAIADDFHLGMSYNLDDGFDITMDEADLHIDRAFSMGNDGLLLGTYTKEQTEKLIFSNKPLIKKLAEEGFDDLSVSLDTSSPTVHKILLRDKGQHQVAAAANNPTPHYVNVNLEGVIDDKVNGLLLMELALRVVSSFDTLKGISGPHRDVRTSQFLTNMIGWEHVNILVAEWLLLQNPTKSFAPDQQPLPGQSYPGLRVGKIIADSMLYLAKERQRDAIVNAPLYFHNAVLYATNGCQFLNPEFEGIFNTLGSDLITAITDDEIGLAVVSRAIFSGRLFHIPSGKRVKWVPGQTQALPVSARMKAAMRSLEYGAIRDSFTSQGVFRLDLDDPGFANDQDWEDAVPLEEVDTRPLQGHPGPLNDTRSSCAMN